jgi:hypothetical protein
MSQFLAIRSGNSGPALVANDQDDVPLWDVATQKWYTGPAPGAGSVDSVFGRLGVVVAATGDYDSDQVDNVSSVAGASVSDALDFLLANAGNVDSVFGRIGVVVAATGDYDSDQVDNLSNVAGSSVSDALDTLRLGSYREVATIAARNAIAANERSAGMLVFVQSLKVTYELAADLTSWVFYDASPLLSLQTAWYVDPLTGNDNNDGSISAPLLTLPELSNRINPRGAPLIMTNDVTVNYNGVAGAVLNDLTLYTTTDLVVPANLTLSVICAVTSSAPITLSAATMPVASTSTRGTLTTLAGTFVNGSMIRITSGAAIGAVAYSAGLNGSALSTFIDPLTIPTIAAAGLVTPLVVAPGDTCVVETRHTTFVTMTLRAEGLSRIFVQNAIARRVQIEGTSASSLFTGSGGNVFLSCCSQSSATGQWNNSAGGAMLLACDTLSTSNTSLRGTGWCLIQHFVRGTLAVAGSGTSYGMCISGGRFILGLNNNFNHPGEGGQASWRLTTDLRNVGGALEVENGAGGTSRYLNAAVVVCSGSQLIVDAPNGNCWGASAAYGYFATLYAAAAVLVGNVSTGSLLARFTVPALIPWSIANLEFAYSDEPIVIENDNARVSGFYDIVNNASQTDGGFYRTAQAGNLGPTAFPGITKAGMYEVLGYIATTVLDALAGAATLAVTFTDDSGVARTVTVATIASTALGGAGGFVVIEAMAASTITWSVTQATPGAAKYSVRMRLRKVCFGA